MRYHAGVILLGLAIAAATVSVLVVGFLRRRTRPLGAGGWLALAVLVVATPLMLRGVEPIATWYTPTSWTAYILLADAAVYAVSGHSRLHDAPGEFLLLWVLSVLLWLVFEAYNLRLENWVYVGLPPQGPARWFGYMWCFATITPGIFETADLVAVMGWFRKTSKPLRLSERAKQAMEISGAALLILPLAAPQHIATYMFALVWLGFIFLLDPINHSAGLPSLIGDFEEGHRDRFYSLLASGWICGWLWELWNYRAAAKWRYIFPVMQHWKIFEMPAPGFLGFLPFALECFTMYTTAAWLVRLLVHSGSAGPTNPSHST